MATVNRAKSEDIMEAKDEFEEFDTDEQSSSPDVGTLDLNIDINNKQDEEERRKLFPASGDYLKNDDWKVETSFNDDDRNPKDIFHKIPLFDDPKNPERITGYIERGRLYISASGRADYIKSGESNFFYYRMSPDPRPARNDATKLDFFYQNWLKAKELYARMNDELPTKLQEVAEMFRSDSFVITNRATDTGAFISGFKVKGQR